MSEVISLPEQVRVSSTGQSVMLRLVRLPPVQNTVLSLGQSEQLSSTMFGQLKQRRLVRSGQELAYTLSSEGR